MSKLITALALVAFAVGCSGEAVVHLTNNSSGYVNGEIDDQSYGINPNGTTTRTIEVGGLFKSGSDVDIVAHVHANSSPSSYITGTLKESIRLEKDTEYFYDVYHPSGLAKFDAAIRLLEANGTGGITRP